MSPPDAERFDLAAIPGRTTLASVKSPQVGVRVSAPLGAKHKFGRPPLNAQSFGYPAPVRSGSLRNSGKPGAHRVGKR